MNMTTIKNTLIPLLEKAGTLFSTHFHKGVDPWEKSKGEWVSKIDIAIQEMLVAELSKAFPDIGFVAEESETSKTLTHEWLWIIDPIDGTNNFTHKLPQCCISIGLFYQKQPQLGIVYQPIGNQWYSATKNQGAFLNDAPIQVSSLDHLPRTIGDLGLHLVDHPGIHLWQFMNALEQNTQALRRFGSLALGGAMVAEGTIDFMITTRANSWDIAAAMLLVLEAGGCVSDFRGNAWHNSKDMVLSNGMIHDSLIELLSPFLTDKLN